MGGLRMNNKNQFLLSYHWRAVVRTDVCRSQALLTDMRSPWESCRCRRATGWRSWRGAGGREDSVPKRRTTEPKVSSGLTCQENTIVFCSIIFLLLTCFIMSHIFITRILLSLEWLAFVVSTVNIWITFIDKKKR